MGEALPSGVLILEERYSAKRRKIPFHCFGVDVGDADPDSDIFFHFLSVAKNQDDFLAHVNSRATEHGTGS